MVLKKTNTANVISSVLPQCTETIDSAEPVPCFRDVQIRWFYREADEKRWTPFNGYDSLNLEAKYNEFNTASFNLTNSWPSGLENLDGNAQCSRSIASEQFKASAMSPAKVSVMCGLFDVDLNTRLCKPVYWRPEKSPMRVHRGIWFKDLATGVYEPLENDAIVDQIESEYCRCFIEGAFGNDASSIVAPNSLLTELTPKADEGTSAMQTTVSAPALLETAGSDNEVNKENASRATSPNATTSNDAKKKTALHTVKFSDFHVDFYGPNEVYLYQDSTSLYIRQKLGMQKVGTRLRRGYKEAARLDDKPPDVTHLCFVVHGIGQKMGIYSINKCVAEFRESCGKLQSKYFAGPEYRNKRVEFLPVEWRSSLQLDGDTVDSITPSHVRGLRTTLNSSAMDILYYTSPLYRTEIITSLLSELNRLYTMFSERNPFFDARGGQVSVLAHSLGCVLIYDLITGWNQPATMLRLNESIAQQVKDLAVLNRSEGGTNHVAQEENESDESPESRGSSGGETQSSDNQLTAGSELTSQQPVKVADNPQKLQHIARLGLQLEAAKTEVSRLERELARLQSKNPGSTPATSPAVVRSTCREKETPCTQSSSNISSQFTASPILFRHNLQNLFCLGSPLPVFLVLRGVRPGVDTTQDSILPRSLCPRIFNIYHPADPVAYRLEPLLLRHYSAIQPAVIHRVDSASKLDYDDLPLVTVAGQEIPRRSRTSQQESDSSEESQQVANNAHDAARQPTADPPTSSAVSDSNRSSITSLVFGLFRSAVPTQATTDPPDCTGRASGEAPPSDQDDEEAETVCCRESVASSLDEMGSTPEANPADESNSALARDDEDDDALRDDALADCHLIRVNEYADFNLQLDHRLDYELRASRYDNLYLSILSAHTCYWTNADVCMLILSQLLNNS